MDSLAFHSGFAVASINNLQRNGNQLCISNYLKRSIGIFQFAYDNCNHPVTRMVSSSQDAFHEKSFRSKTFKLKNNRKTELDPFWENFDNLSNQLADFCAIHNHPAGILPTNVYLRAKGAHVLVEAIAKHGGPEPVSQKLGWKLPKQSKWTPLRSVLRDRELESLTEQVVELIKERNLAKDEMPSRETIRKYKPVLMNKICAGRSHYEKIAQRLGFEIPKKTRKKKQVSYVGYKSQEKRIYGYWTDMNNIAKELENFCKQNDFNQRIVPASQQLLAKGRSDIWYAIARKGGERLVASHLGLHCSQDWRYFEEFLYLVKEIHQFCLQYNCIGMMPSYRVFRLAGRPDLATLILRHGGNIALGARLGLKLHQNTGKNRLLNWGPFSIEFAIECLEFTKQHCSVVEGMIRIPSKQCMLLNGREDLVDTVESYGGIVQVARRLGLAPPSDEDWVWLSVDSISENNSMEKGLYISE
ncbi:hypothetical protein Gasu2_70460 [Galdieria sulphuraria]|uniref:Uncharacterized protein n=1 Tax=Galdieria sulphuraria TaxID=130081 RepID=M2XJR4_GALSU|nr:uncharacterized protein Gasu_22560 [Galdieria sulphuraria]EME30347.1 hypothetical protein Gasu_22560 [Galdieria sulphuraria]GJD12990.1 hypothetical protein Gasu2_70460 [Galdieria sulphuraria]|eukprot:XP_005706867.1 hypothetical protein Gasu_22560 [Galdieria sulphuraria]